MRRDKKGISIMIGYVLLVTAAIVMGVIAFQWIKSYVPSEALSCPDDVSIFIEDYWCDDVNNAQLNLTIKNNGKFSIAGVFVNVANDPDIEIGSINVGSSISRGGVAAGNAVVFLSDDDNSMLPGDEKIITLDMYKIAPEKVYLVEITPTRYQEVEGKLKFVNCGGARVKERIGDQDPFTENCYFPTGCVDTDVDAFNPHFERGTCTDIFGITDIEDECNVNALTEYICNAESRCVTQSIHCDITYGTSCTPSGDSCNAQQPQ